MRALVTGAAGFIASHLVERLLAENHEVRGVDCFTPYYSADRKRGHLARVRSDPQFELVTADLTRCDLGSLLAGVDVVFHLAGQPGVRPSWDGDFAGYADHNVLATQRMLHAASDQGVHRFVFASSSSVYGDQRRWPTEEDAPTHPSNPYGVTKLAAEHLCRVYADSHQVPAVILRYFTVYGPRQRPDMALHRMLAAVQHGESFPLYGTGRQVRDFTYVGDVVAATMAAGVRNLPPGTVLNVAGGSAVSLAELVSVVEEVVGRPVPVRRGEPQPGDVSRTGGATALARDLLDWEPRMSLRDGVRAQAKWQLGSG